MAWFERLYAERSLVLVDAMMAEADLQITGTTAQLAAGKMGAADPVMVRGQRASLADRRLEIERTVRRAEARLTRWLARTRGGCRRETPTSPGFRRACRDSPRTSTTTRNSRCSRP